MKLSQFLARPSPRNRDNFTSTYPNFLGRCERKLEPEIEVLCSLPFLQTPDDLEIQTMLLNFPGATEATQNWVKGTARFACRESYVPPIAIHPSSVFWQQTFSFPSFPSPGIPYLWLDFILYFSRRRPREEDSSQSKRQAEFKLCTLRDRRHMCRHTQAST